MINRTPLIFVALVAFAVASVASTGQAAAAGGFSYIGETSQNEHISLKVNARSTRVRMLYVDWSASAVRCTNRREYMSSTMLGMWGSRPPGIRGGRFSSRITEEFPGETGGPTVEKFSLRGRVNGSRASGTLQVQVTERNATGRIVNRCTTGQISWSAAD
jgi:hypothetical protein